MSNARFSWQLKNSQELGTLHSLPVKLSYDGPAKVKEYFDSFVKEENQNDKNEPQNQGFETVQINEQQQPQILQEEAKQDQGQDQEQKPLDKIDNENQVYKANFQGRLLLGKKIKLPENYVGIIIEQESLSNEWSVSKSQGVRTYHQSGQFQDFFFWQWDQKPDGKSLQERMINYMKINRDMHKGTTKEFNP